MSNYRRTYLAGGTFFFTLVTQNRRRLFAQEAGRRCLGEALRAVQAEQPFEMKAVVLMPNHLHCIWTLPDDDAPARPSIAIRRPTDLSRSGTDIPSSAERTCVRTRPGRP